MLARCWRSRCATLLLSRSATRAARSCAHGTLLRGMKLAAIHLSRTRHNFQYVLLLMLFMVRMLLRARTRGVARSVFVFSQHSGAHFCRARCARMACWHGNMALSMAALLVSFSWRLFDILAR